MSSNSASAMLNFILCLNMKPLRLNWTQRSSYHLNKPTTFEEEREDVVAELAEFDICCLPLIVDDSLGVVEMMSVSFRVLV